MTNARRKKTNNNHDDADDDDDDEAQSVQAVTAMLLCIINRNGSELIEKVSKALEYCIQWERESEKND